MQFAALHDTLNDAGSLPPKRILATTFVPSAWLDDTLIAERKAGLSAYLTGLVASPQFRAHKFFVEFLTSSAPTRAFTLEDALPSTLSRKAALEVQPVLSAEATPIAAAYYPDWASDSNPPASLDFSKFDILLFGTYIGAFAYSSRSACTRCAAARAILGPGLRRKGTRLSVQGTCAVAQPPKLKIRE